MRKTCLNMVHELARQDERVVFIGSDLGAGTLDAMRDEFPDRFFMEGVNEQNMIGMAAGMAMEGYIPFVNTIATFITRRCYEQVAVDLCLHNLPVKLIGNGGGLVYAPLGPTHLAIEDVAIMRSLPNMAVFAPCDAEEMTRLVHRTMDLSGPCYIRLAKGGDPVVSEAGHGFAIGEAIEMAPPAAIAFITTGVTTTRALEAVEVLAARGIEAGVLHHHTLKPLDGAAVLRYADSAEVLITVEEHLLAGGLGSMVAELLAERRGGRAPMLRRLGIPDRFPEKYGSQDELFAHFGLDPEGLVDAALSAASRPQADAA